MVFGQNAEKIASAFSAAAKSKKPVSSVAVQAGTLTADVLVVMVVAK
ncbi:MAG: hypothetical protein H8E38_09645 [SAR324 cluster bacterium]|nr:hypothetical protein [SAR324 cluster bacterium]